MRQKNFQRHARENYNINYIVVHFLGGDPKKLPRWKKIAENAAEMFLGAEFTADFEVTKCAGGFFFVVEI